MENDKAPTRKGSPAIKVRVLPDEKAKIEALAASVNESASSYLRLVGLGHQPRMMIDLEQARELVRVNGDLGRLGGLLKLWLTDNDKLDGFPNLYTARAGVIVPLFDGDMPPYDGRGGMFDPDQISIRRAELDACPADELLTIAVWDQS